MTPEERQLLTALADRIRSAPVQTRDAEAEQLLAQLLAQKPETPYLLAQTVLMQDFALRNAQAQIQQLQQQVAEAQKPAASSGGSFLGSLFGGGQPAQPAAPASVPGVNPWARPAAAAAAPAPQQAYYPQQPAYQPVTMQPSQTSGFLRQAATTAAGVAGGALLFEGIESLFSGHQGFGGGYSGAGFGGGGGWGGGGWGGGQTGSLTETTIINNNTYVEPDADPSYASDNSDSGYQDTVDDSGFDDSSGSDSGGDWA